MKASTKYTFFILGLLFMFNKGKTHAQQLPDFSFSKESMFLYNPSVAGHGQGMYIFSTFRSQWGKIEGSPFTANIGFHTPLRNKRINLGASIFNDFTGPTSYSGISGSFSYRIILDKGLSRQRARKAISFGLSLGANSYRLNAGLLQLDQPDDPGILANTESKMYPDASFGVLYEGGKYYIAAAVPQLLQLSVPFEGRNGRISNFTKMQHYHVAVGGKISLQENFSARDISLDPDIHIHYVIGAPPQITSSLRYSIESLLSVGLGYRSTSHLMFLGGFTVLDRFSIGYAYDMNLSNNRAALGQIHEVHISYDFRDNLFGY